MYIYHCKLAYFNHIRRLSQSGIIIRNHRNASTDVWITSDDQPISSRVISLASIPRSDVIETPTGPVRRNRQHLNIIPDGHQPNDQTEQPIREPIQTRSRTGTQIRPPDRL